MLDDLRLNFSIGIMKFTGELELFESCIVCHESFVGHLFGVAKYF